jgi:NADH-quinone oxidoreductase subunit I
MWTVPPPPATDLGAEQPKELATATGTPTTTTRARREPPAATSASSAAAAGPPAPQGEQVDVPGAGQTSEPGGEIGPQAGQAAEGDADTAPDSGGPA